RPGRPSHATDESSSRWRLPQRLGRGWQERFKRGGDRFACGKRVETKIRDRQPFAPGRTEDLCVERILPMNPADVAQAALPMASSDVSLIALFLQAHWVVKAVMLGLLACSVWVWAIAIDKIFLYSRTRRAMDRFEQAFWSGQSIEELYRTLSAKPTQSMAACFVAAMREWKRSFESHSRSIAGLQAR